MEDHRSLQLWERVDGREGWRAFYAATSDSWRPFYAGTSDTDDDARDFTVLETVAGDARVVAARVSWSFVINGAEGAIECGIVVRVEGGLALGLDVYDPGDTEAILARFAELAGKRGAPQDRPPARLYARVMELLGRGDIDGVLDLYAPGATLIDRRAIVAQDALGEPKDFRGFFEGILAGFPDVRFDGDEMLACDDCVCVLRTILGGHAADGGGEVELPFGVVECIEAERITHVELYGYDDVGAMIARYAELGGGLSVLGDSPPERFYAAFARGFARRDIDAMLEFVAPDVVHVDHREIGWEPLRGHAGYRATIESGWAEMADVRLEIAEVLALADDAIALRVRWIGHGDQSAGFAEFSLDVGTVSSFAAGRLAHVDQFDADDREAILTRFAELQARAS
jgi:ketosteroid isomerase-like protein